MKRWQAVGVVGALIVLASTCWWVARGGRLGQCPLESVVLTPAQLTGDWQVADEELYPYRPLKQDAAGAEEAYVTILDSESTDGLGHTVYRYSSSALAKFHIWLYREIDFSRSCTDWEPVLEVPGVALQAEQFILKCGPDHCLAGYDRYDRCRAIMRYGNYVSNLEFTSRRGTANAEGLAEFLAEIDQQFRLCRP